MVQPNLEDVVKAIATDTNTPVETVSTMYADTWAEYSDGARILDYLTVLVARRVRENLRRARQDRHEATATELIKLPLDSQRRGRVQENLPRVAKFPESPVIDEDNPLRYLLLGQSYRRAVIDGRQL